VARRGPYIATWGPPLPKTMGFRCNGPRSAPLPALQPVQAPFRTVRALTTPVRSTVTSYIYFPLRSEALLCYGRLKMDPPHIRSSRDLCTYCKAIPFLKLPSEHEPGVAHQPSLASLKRSAKTCPLCHLLLEAAELIRRKINDEGKNDNSNNAEWREFSPAKQTPGKTTMMIRSLGKYSPGSNIATGHPRSVTLTEQDSASGKPANNVARKCHPFASDEAVRPYLYGNWWKVYKWKDGDQKHRQLLGIGVRLATSPDIVDAEGSVRNRVTEDGTAEDTVWLRGSYLRIRTDDGMFSPQLRHCSTK
jgi:hypothetical protein